MKNLDKLQTELTHKAIDKLFNRVNAAGHTLQSIGNITITKRYNGATGNHMHATCSVKLRFDESVTEADTLPVEPTYSKY
jgi:hypothetical protein